jgi:hypothetical protein
MARTAHHDAPGNADGGHATPEMRGMMQAPEVVLESYARFVRQIESLNRLWIGGVRQTAEAGWDLASQMADSAIADGRRMSELYVRFYEADVSAATSALRQMRSNGRHLSTVQRAAAGD